MLGKAAINHAFIGHTLDFQGIVKVMVKGLEKVPDLKEARLHVGILTCDINGKPSVLLEEMAEKGFQGIFLSRCKIGIIILDLLEISHIGEKLVRICKIFIDVIEIGKNHVTPENELVKRLSPGVQSRIAVIQFKQQAYPVS